MLGRLVAARTRHFWWHEEKGSPEAEDPKEPASVSPFLLIAPIGLPFLAAYRALRGWNHCPPLFQTVVTKSALIPQRDL
jgi:hypothetical protein